MRTPLSSIVLILISSFIGSFGAVFLKLGAEYMRPGVKGIVSNYRLALGVGLYLLSSVFFVMGVAQGELTILYPMVSLGYIWTLLWAYLFFQEPFGRAKIFGLTLIIAGVAFINLGNAG
ncbi:MAG: EamA family transporter [Bryobacteraceae bacterium]